MITIPLLGGGVLIFVIQYQKTRIEEEDKISVELKEIIRLINVVNNLSYIHLEDYCKISLVPIQKKYSTNN